MANGTPITVIGNLTADPELRTTPSGDAVVNFSVAVTPRRFDRESNSWVDGETSFYRVTAWRKLAEHVAGSLRKGQRVVVSGEIAESHFQDKEGNKRSSFEVTAADVGASLQFGTVVFQKGVQSQPVQQQAPMQQAPMQQQMQQVPPQQMQQQAPMPQQMQQQPQVAAVPDPSGLSW